MKTLPLIFALVVLFYIAGPEVEACGRGGRSSGGRSGSGYGYRSSSSPRGRKVTVKVGRKKATVYVGKTGIRGRDSTGHRTGLGTLGRSMVRQPVKTVKAIGAFVKSYNKMRKANVKGGNLKAHQQANYDATKIANSKVASAISALREQYKSFRAKKNPDGTVHIGDTRTAKETKNTMDANKRGRDKAKQDMKKQG